MTLIAKALSVALVVLGMAARPATAHPHVTVTARATLNIEQGAIASITHVWTFDEFYSASAVDGLPKNAAGGYGRAELAELAKVNIDGLKEFAYFTFVTLDGAEQKVGDPKPDAYWLEHNDGLLSLHFTVPLEKPVLVDAKGFQAMVTDPSYFIAFTMAETDPVSLSGPAPANCRAVLAAPPVSEDQKKLSGVFAQQLGGAALGLDVAKAIMVQCGP
jgi:ABC-type uncharacterized transport system substrate-binding protein